MDELRALLTGVAERVADYRARVGELPVFPRPQDLAATREALGRLHDDPVTAAGAVDELVRAVEPSLVGSAGPRYFGFVTGGALPSATAADMLTAGWDQLAYNTLSSPAAALVEEVAGAWLKELLGLPAAASFGFVTGAQGANTVALAAARQHLLATAGWDVERDGLGGAPPVRVVASVERHATIDRALRLLGLGTASLRPVAADGQGAIDLTDLQRVLAADSGPTVLCLQAGNVNTGAVDDLAAATAAGHRYGAWVHVDGAFGLWASAAASTRHLTTGIADADSWATDGHKWLNVCYDSGYVFCAHPRAHVTAMAYGAAYLGPADGALRSPGDHVPESSRRARGFATWAALRQLGREGVADLIERCCGLARRFGEQLSALPDVAVVNDVVLNQVLVRYGDDDGVTDAVIAAVQRSGECWMGATSWHGMRLMRISVSSWATTEADVDRSVAAIRTVLQSLRSVDATV